MTMDSIQVAIWKELILLHPHKYYDSEQYWERAGEIINDNHIDRKFLSEKLLLRLNKYVTKRTKR